MEIAAVVLALPALVVAMTARGDTPAPQPETPPAAQGTPPAPAGSPAPAPPPAPSEPAVATPDVVRMEPSSGTLRLRMGLKHSFFIYPAVPPVAREARAVLLFAGDWGWKPVLQDTASYLASKGRTVIGVDSQDFFTRDMEAVDWSRDLRALRDYANEKAGLPAGTPVLFVGYTWGATMLPFMFNRGGVDGVAGALLIGPAHHSNRIFRVTLQMPTNIVPLPKDEEFLTLDEVKRLAPIPVVLMQGAQDMESACDDILPLLKGPKQIVNVPGGDRQFHDVRDIYFSLTAQALGWLEGKH
jgi:type IV secretory pathway VirJ component